MVQVSAIYGKAANEHETAPRVNALRARDGPLTRPLDSNASTVYELALESFQKGGNRRGMGWREITEIHEEVKIIVKKIDGKNVPQEKTWLYYEMTPYRHNTYRELISIMHNLGRGMVKAGIKPNGENKLHIFASTSHKWMKMFLGAQSQNIPVVTAYDTLGERGLIHSMLQTESNAVFTDNDLLTKLINPLKEAKDLKFLIHSETINPKDTRQNGKLRVNTKLNHTHLNQKICHVSCIPLVLQVIHANIVAGVGGVCHNVYGDVGQNDRIIAFLPLAHIFELAFELAAFYWNGILGYANVKTLTNLSVRRCQGDMVEFKPTIMVGVAAVWETVRKGILAKLGELPAYTQKIFWTAYKSKVKLDEAGLPGGGLISKLVFKKVKEATGGCLRIIMNGGSPISEDAQRFLTNVLCPMLIGYGLTETVANATVLSLKAFKYGIAGDLSGAIQVKLVDAAELGYLAKDNQGEIWIKGAPVMSEYFKNEEETKKALTEDGWFRTGDIGEWNEDGQLIIIDRKKNLVKTLNGEYIALEKLESLYRSNKYVQNICVYADQTKVKPVGIVVGNMKPLEALANSLGLLTGEETIDSVLHDKKLAAAVLKDMLATGKSQGLNGIELLQGIVFFDDEWTPQNGYVTSAQKLKRKEILEAVKDQVEAVYKN
ncbi:AMP-binding enzyme [Nakaseomyces glabratus]